MRQQDGSRRPPVHHRAATAGVAFVGLGLVFLLEALGVFELSPGVLWPLLVIVLGVGLVISGTGRNRPPPVPPETRRYG